MKKKSYIFDSSILYIINYKRCLIGNEPLAILLSSIINMYLSNYSNRAIPAPIYVSETLLKKRKANEKGAAVKARQRMELKKV